MAKHTLTEVEVKNVSWNGISMVLPKSWEAKAIGTNHLHFEANFQPMLEIRWQKTPQKTVEDLITKAIKRLEQTLSYKLHEVAPPKSYQKCLGSFIVRCFAAEKNNEPQYIFLYHEKGSQFLTLQFPLHSKQEHPLQQISKLECVVGDDPQPWSIQDFRFSIPSSYCLQSHSMDAGFTALNFKNTSTVLHICRLAPANLRLQHSTLEEILASLLGLNKQGEIHQSPNSFAVFERNPSLLRQILYRMQRKKPFILSKIWHDSENNRLLGVFMEAVHPIDEDVHDMICTSYEFS